MTTYCHGSTAVTRDELKPLIGKYGKVVKVTQILNRHSPEKIRELDTKAITEGGDKVLEGIKLQDGQHNFYYDHGGVFTVVTYKGKFVWTCSGKTENLPKEN